MTIWAIPAIICGLLAATLQNTNAAMLASPLWLRPFIAGDTISFYLYKIFVPVNIGPDFGRSPLFVRAHLWGYATWLVPISLGFFLAFGRDKTRSLLSGALSVFIFALIPFAGLLAFEAQATSTVASRYAYLAMLGPALALGALASIPRRPATGVLAVAVLIALGFMTQTQIKSWQNDETLWKKALAVNANSPIAHAVLAEQYRLQQNWDEARLHYRKVLEVNASDPKTHFYLAEIERRQGDLPQALELYRKTLELDPTYSPAYNSYGLALLASGQINEALERFTKAVELTPNSSEPLVNLGRLYAQMKKFPEAVPVLNKALSIQGAADTRSQKQLAEIHALLGLALASTNDDVKAQTHLEMALKLDGTSAESHRTLADIYFVQKRYADALSHYQEAAKSITDDPEVFNNIGVILAMEKKYDKAVVQYEKALALRPEFISAHTSVGTAYFFLRKFPDATNHFRRSLALDPNQADPHYYLGDMARWQNKESEALGEYYAALKIDPNHVDSHYRLGNHFLKKEQMDQAIRHYQAALKVAPNDPRLIGQLRRAERAMQTLPM
jgi:tetratricopeptide (TPR) repeat protein